MTVNGNELIRINTVKIPFDVVAERIIQKYNIVTTDGRNDFFVEVDGEYTSAGAKEFLDRSIREEYKKAFAEKWKKFFPLHPLPGHIPAAKKAYVKETLAYIHAYRYVPRQEIPQVLEGGLIE